MRGDVTCHFVIEREESHSFETRRELYKWKKIPPDILSLSVIGSIGYRTGSNAVFF